MNKVCVVGSINIDITIEIKDLPKLGETVFGKALILSPGGKGLNQCIAAKRSGAMVYMIGKIGKDSYGKKLIDDLIKENINIEGVYEDSNVITGTTVITVDENGGESRIVVSGANMSITTEQIKHCRNTIKKSDVIISQLEIPIETISHSFKYAKEEKKITILNPVTSRKIPDSILKYTDIIVINRNNVESILGTKIKDIGDLKIDFKHFFNMGIKFIIAMLDKQGVIILSNDNNEIISPYSEIQSYTGLIEDSFIGGFSSKFNDKDLSFESIREAVIFGNQVASVTMEKQGGQKFIPLVKDVSKIYDKVE